MKYKMDLNKKIEQICTGCGAKFIFHRKKKFCSDFCKNKSSREKRVDKLREYYAKWYKKNGRKRAEDYTHVIAEWRVNNPEKAKVHDQIHYKIYTYDKPKNCSYCGKEKKVYGHHMDYNKPLDVVFLCQSCHKQVHTGRIILPIDVKHHLL